MSDNKGSFGLGSGILLIGLVAALVVNVTSLYGEAERRHIDRTGGESKLVDERANKAVAKTFATINQCEALNRRIGLQTRSMQRYSEFNANCNFIWNQAQKLALDKDSILGVSIVSYHGVERYYPVIKSGAGGIQYPGGFPATFDYQVISKADISKLNSSLKAYGIK